MNQKDKYLLWFGCDYTFWKDQGNYFVIGVGDEDEDFSQAVINRFKARFGQQIKVSKAEEGSWYFVPIAESLIEDSDNIKKLAHFIAEVAEHNNSTKITTK